MNDDRRWTVEGEPEDLDLRQLVEAKMQGRLEGKAVRLSGRETALSLDDLNRLADEVNGSIIPPPSANYPRPNPQSGPSNANDDPLRFVVLLNPSIWAILSGYLGLGSALCIFGPFAIITAILAFREIKKDPTKTGKGRAIFGLVMGCIGTGGLIYIALMSANRPPNP